MKNKIKLSVIHNNASRMEYFLNSVEEELVEVPFEWQSWKLADQIQGACKFVSAGSEEPVTISVLFCNSYHGANEIGNANRLPLTPTAHWSINGDVMYLVESTDSAKVSDVLGLFAGRE